MAPPNSAVKYYNSTASSDMKVADWPNQPEHVQVS
jgi:hypothetical protein